jgi:hypothetical protein
VFDVPPFSLAKRDKAALFASALAELTAHHRGRCAPYRRILDTLGVDAARIRGVEDVPFLPVRLFKEFDLASVSEGEVTRVVTSSGTSQQPVSRVFLDRTTAVNQARALARIVSSFSGPARLPMLVLDSPAALRDRSRLSARGAGIVGFSLLGRDVTFALDEQMELDRHAIDSFCRRYPQAPVLLFGFTHLIWEHVYKPLARSGDRVPLDNGILFHGGGWKKMAAQAVGRDVFRQSLRSVCGVERVHDYYGMAEQAGSIFVECEAGYLHSSVFSDVIVRDAEFSVCQHGEPGLVQVLSLLPHSYPGHSLLSDDVGRIVGEDDCLCGRLGKYMSIDGRLQDAEARGCGDTYAGQ